MAVSQSLITSLLEVLISSKNKSVFICHLSNLTLQIIFNTWWASVNGGSKHSIQWNDSGHVSSWQFYLCSGIEKTGSPGIMFIVCHQVLRHPSEHATSSIVKQLLVKAHIAKFKEETDSEVSELPSIMVNETALARPKWQGSWWITIVSLQRIFIFDIQDLTYFYTIDKQKVPKWPLRTL